jgi:chemotaxis protein methyltransferase CheR
MTDIAQLADFIRSETGIVLSGSREPSLRAAVGRAAPDLSLNEVLAVIADPLRRPALVDRLIDEVTARETTFVRDRRQFDAIDWHGLLRRARAAGSDAIRVWSAGCATGEEPYTLAILAAEMLHEDWVPVDVLGTDISTAALAAAADGRYGQRSVRDLDARMRGDYFVRGAHGAYLVGDQLRKLVRFRRHNLVKDPIPPADEPGFDLIVCRNVLIYFEAQLAVRLIESFERALRPGGMLLLGSADVLQRTAARAHGHAAQRSGSASARHQPMHQPMHQPLRQPLGREERPSREQRLAAALEAADRGDRNAALARVASLIKDNPMDSDAQFIRGLVTLEAGDPAGAADALRRALYVDADFALAAFTLGRAYDALGDEPAALRSYRQALRTLNPDDDRHNLMLQQVDIGDIAAACRTRLGGKS